MFVHMSIHYVKPESKDLLIESMKRFGNAMKNYPGFRNAYVFEDAKTGNLVGMALWDSKEQMLAARPAMAEAVEDDDFEAWEEHEPDSLLLEQLYAVNPEE
jgi:heme-degrading monooxygenase HmoA